MKYFEFFFFNILKHFKKINIKKKKKKKKKTGLKKIVVFFC